MVSSIAIYYLHTIEKFQVLQFNTGAISYK